ncbi:MAG: methylenetetrahydrofolate reductase, partial [Sedimenticolaceae bacterium]
MTSTQVAERTFSFELFPPKTDQGVTRLRDTVSTLNARHPAFFSVTYGAGGSTQSNTFATVDWIKSQGIEVAPHLSCIGSKRSEIVDILSRYASQAIRRIVA